MKKLGKALLSALFAVLLSAQGAMQVYADFAPPDDIDIRDEPAVSPLVIAVIIAASCVVIAVLIWKFKGRKK